MNTKGGTWRPGQYGAYLKPVLVLIFLVLMLVMLQSLLGFQTGMEEERVRVDFQQEVRRDVQNLVDCLRVDREYSGSSYVLNYSKLAAYHRQYRLREPPCAEDMTYGYNVTVTETFLTSRNIKPQPEGPADVVFALDDSGSMGGYLQAVKDNVRSFMENMPQGSRVGMFTYATPCQNSNRFDGWTPNEAYPNKPHDDVGVGDSDIPDIFPDEYAELDCWADNVVPLSEDVSPVENELAGIVADGGAEPEDGAIRFAREYFDWNDGRRKIIIVLATESAETDSATNLTVYAEAEVAEEQGFEVFTVAEEFYKEQYGRIADITGAEFFPVSDDFSSILGEISRSSDPGIGESTCVAPKKETDDEENDRTDETPQGEEEENALADTDVMCQPTYKFGELEGSAGNGLKRDMVLQYPVTIWHREDLQTPAILAINIRDGDLERLSSAVNAVIRQGEQSGEEATGTLRIRNDQELHFDRQRVERPVETRYKLIHQRTGSDRITVRNDLKIGINGNTVFSDDDGGPTTIDFSDPANHFTGYRGAAIQFIVKNLDGSANIDPVAVQCVSGNCNGEQEIHINDGDNSPFAYGFTDLDIGNVDQTEEPVACIRRTGDDNCAVLRADSVSGTTLKPGNHLLRITYDPFTGEVTVRE